MQPSAKKADEMPTAYINQLSQSVINVTPVPVDNN
jgi:hypothetical protein